MRAQAYALMMLLLPGAAAIGQNVLPELWLETQTANCRVQRGWGANEKE